MTAAAHKSASRRFASDTRQLESVRTFVEDAAKRFGFSESDIANIVLAVDEACTNIIKHAYGGKPDGTIDVNIQPSGKSFTIRIQDRGKAFNPEHIETPNLRKHLTEFHRGGLGVYLMRRMMDRVEYDIRPGKQNEVILTKLLSTASQDNGS